MSKDEAGFFRKWWEPWRKMPELESLPADLASRTYSAAWRRLIWSGRFWMEMATLALPVAIPLIFPFVFPFLFRVPLIGWTVYMATCLVSAGLINWRMDLMHRRCARIELGTHCSKCDYDLRGTSDPSGPRLTRCPECGLPVSA